MSIGPLEDLSLEWLLDAAPSARRFGVEHEFSAVRDAATVDFRDVLRARSAGGRRLDRSDPFARRLPWGGVITADGPEAECATPPAALAPGFTDSILGWAAQGHGALRSLAEDVELRGYSTHLSVEVDDRRAVALADRFARRHSAAMMLLMDGIDAPGLLVRPRRSRLELGADYITDQHLVAASVFAAAATLDCETARYARPLSTPRVVPARGRFGVFVDRCAFGADLSAHGRGARLGKHTAQDLLTWSWERCREHASRFAAAHELSVVDRVVDGSLPLPSEAQDASRGQIAATGAGSGHVDLTIARRSAAMHLEPLLATWDHVCFRLQVDRVTRIVAVPAALAARLVEAFESGTLDSWCRRAAEIDPRRLATLSSADQIGGGGVFSSVDPDATLMPPERNPRTGRPGGVGNVPGQRQQKNHDETPGRRMRGKHLVGAAAAGLVVIAGAVALATRDDSSPSSAAATTDAASVTTTAGTEAVDTTVAAVVVPVTDAATTIAPTTTVAGPVCSTLDLAPDSNGTGATAPVLAGVVVSADTPGTVEVQLGDAVARLDAATSVSCADASTLTQSGGRSWTRTGADPVVVQTAQGDVTVAPESVVVVDCRTATGCTVIVVQGSATLPGGPIVAPAAGTVGPDAAIQMLAYDAVFGDPWIGDNVFRDVAAGFPNPADMFVSYGPSAASLAGHFTGQRAVVTAECTAGPCDVGSPVGDVAPRTYDFSVDCTNSPCVGTVAAQFNQGDSIQTVNVPLAFDGTNYTWDINSTTYQCTYDTDGNGSYDARLGTLSLTIHYVLTPTAAEVRNGQYVVTAFHAIGDATNTISAPDPQCVGFGPSHNVGDITASR